MAQQQNTNKRRSVAGSKASTTRGCKVTVGTQRSERIRGALVFTAIVGCCAIAHAYMSKDYSVLSSFIVGLTGAAVAIAGGAFK